MATVAKEIRGQVGERLRELRRAHRITQERLAERAGLSYKFVGEIERGQANPTIDTLYQLSKALRIDIYELFLTPGRETGPGSMYRFGLHEVAIVREALQSADQLLDRAGRRRIKRPR
jgi:transcriptional regulator with XRE-family HTH domain